MQNKERGAVSWLMEFAGEKRIFYIVSVIAAIIGVICSVAPFLFVSDIVIRLIERKTRWSGYCCIYVYDGRIPGKLSEYD